MVYLPNGFYFAISTSSQEAFFCQQKAAKAGRLLAKIERAHSQPPKTAAFFAEISFFYFTGFPFLTYLAFFMKGNGHTKHQEHWGSRLGIILAVMGSAIGLGNFLRFPGLAAKYGGSFLIPYAVALLLLGLPIAWAEWSIGRMGGRRGFHSSPGILQAVCQNRFASYFGVLGLVVPLGIFMYYVFIEAWCLYYAWQYLAGGFSLGREPGAYKSFFESFTGQGANGALVQGGLTPAVSSVLICYILNFIIVYRGISRGIEKISRYAIPFLFLCSFVILARVFTLGTPDPALPERNLFNGLGFMWNPGDGKDFFASLWNSEMWLAAAGQVFFSLSVGFGIIINYSSYLRKNEDVLLSSTTAASGNVFAEVALGSMITVPAAFMFLGAAGVGDSSFSLGFVTLPNVFARMPLGQAVGFLWFFLLFLAALTSSISMLQPVLAFFEEGLRIRRRLSLLSLLALSLLGTGFIMYFSKDSRAMDMIDFWIGTVFIYILATVLVIIFGWVIGAKKGWNEARQGSLLRVPYLFAFVLKYISPVYLLIIFYFWVKENLPAYWQQIQGDAVARYTVLFVLFLLVLFGVLITTALRKWQTNKNS